MKKVYLEKEFKRLMDSRIGQPIAGLVATLSDKCDSVIGINEQNIFYNQGVEGNSVVCLHRDEMKILMPNISLFQNLRQLIPQNGSHLYMDWWPQSLEQVTLFQPADISKLNRLPKLKQLGLRYHDADLGAIRPIAEQIVTLGFHSAKEEKELAHFKNLELLTYGLQETDMSHFSSLTKLRRLFIERFSCGTLDGVEGCKALEYLRIQSGDTNPLYDLSALSKLSSLKNLTLVKNEVMDISPLEKLPLESLALSEMPLLDFSPLGGMKSLKELNISNCMLDDLSVLEGLEQLEKLTLRNTHVTDFTPLLKLPSLKELEGCNSWELPQELREKLGIAESPKPPRIERRGFESRAVYDD